MSTSFGTPSRVPRNECTSIFKASSTTESDPSSEALLHIVFLLI
jgi:hypothetical protein